MAQLRQAGATVELKGPDGNVIGRFTAERRGKQPPGVRSTFTREEMEARRRNHRSGRPLGDILRDREGR